ncbi:uncharacterized protein B0H18DRAFT_909010 [Fomitopsis serialis]|uniref:uncharacterized protein n=1 Tax=Fomitopsis serialis TaxID=139415 RepID=UPI0020082D29|nr:uncharacterized protein B0H18DRAFT_909010 [Neoantrodia serialis]KAH9924890.1 hypothetical protein B0H18DRAFT_909010 [Neoantrodia serialis]
MDYFDFNMNFPAEAEGPDATQFGFTGGEPTQRTPVGTPMERPNADRAVTVDVSTTFQPNVLVDNLSPDLVLISSDQVYFYAHSHRILSASCNTFNGLLTPTPPPDDGSTQTVSVPEPAEVLNVVVHALYSLPVAQFMPPLDTVTAAFDSLITYGVPLQTLVLPGSPLYVLVLSQAPLRPIDAYALAAHHDLLALAIPISAHLLSYTLSSLTDELAARIGPIYLKRLFFLHHGRMEALKRLLLHPPQAHEPTRECNATQQQRLTRAWALASAHLAWDARPNISTNMLQAPLLHLERELSCPLCKGALRDRVSVLVREWASVKVTI